MGKYSALLLIYLAVVVAVAIWQRSWLSLLFGAIAAVLGVLRVWTWDRRDGL